VAVVGTVETFDAASISVKNETGAVEAFKLSPNLVVVQNKPATLNDIKPNDFVASAAVRKEDGKLHSTELRIFPDIMRGVGEGQRPMNDPRNQTMTNATVTGTAIVGGSNTIKVKFRGRRIRARRRPGRSGHRDRARGQEQVKAGVKVRVQGARTADGAWPTASRCSDECARRYCSPASRSTRLRFRSQPAAAGRGRSEEAWAALANGGHVVLIRHGNAPGTGDPAGVKIDDCKTQRNLDDAGREQSRVLGKAFAIAVCAVTRVLSSPWCRCLETARLMAVGSVESSMALLPDRDPANPARRLELKESSRPGAGPARWCSSPTALPSSRCSGSYRHPRKPWW
jgi:hypothetical protein